jgi:hypothetical protein
MRKTLNVGLISAGMLLIGGAPAMAAPLDWTSTGNIGLLNGNQVYIPAQVPVNVCGLAIGILGDASAGCEGGASAVYNGGGSAQHLVSSGNIGLGNGNQVVAKVQAPINVCGVAISVLGSANAGCKGGSDSVIEPPSNGGGNGYDHKPARTLPAKKKSDAPKAKVIKKRESLGGVLTGLLGIGDKEVKAARYNGGADGGSCDLNWTSVGNIGLLSGNQVYVPVQAPVDVSGVAATIGGTASAYSQGGASATYC